MPLVPVSVDQKWTWVVPSQDLIEIRGVGVAGPAGPAGAPGAPGPNQLLTGKTLWVDLTNGNNGTAVRGDAAKPFLDLGPAQTAALAGDTIVVRPGAYAITAPLGKHLVNWHFEVGASVTRTETDPLADVSVWDDGGAAMTFTVTGAGDFTIVLTSNANAVDADVIRVRHASSVIAIDGQDFNADDTIGSGNCIRMEDGNLVVHCRDASGSNSGIWWINGELSVTGRAGRSARYAVYSTVNVVPTGDAYVAFNSIQGTGINQAVLVEGGNAEAAIWVRAETVRGGSGGVAVACQSPSGGNRLYVECQKVFGMIQETNGYSSLMYVRADKVSPVVTTSPLFYSGSGFAWIQVNDWDAATLTTNAFEVPGGTADIFGGRVVAGFTGFNVNSGTLRLHGVHATINGTGVLILNGSARLNACFIDSSASAIASPVFKTGGTLTLANSTLVAQATRNAIEVFNAQTVSIDGTLTTNRPSHASVTFTGGVLVRTDTGEVTSDGPLTVRQFGGTQGTDEVVIAHDGGAATFRNRDVGGYDFLDQAGTGLLLDLSPSLASFFMPVLVRQPGGGGSDAGRLSHDGTSFYLRNQDTGGILFRNSADTFTTFEVDNNGVSHFRSVSQTITVDTVNQKITTPGNQLVLEQTGDTHGTTRLYMRSRDGETGFVGENAGLDLFDFVFRPSSGSINQRIIRLENRAPFSYIGAPELQFGDPINPTLSVSDAGALVRRGYFAVRQPGGVVGTDEIRITHNGTAALLRNMDTGGIGFLNALGTVTTFSVTDGGLTTTGSTLTVRQSGGVAGVDEVSIGHDGSAASFLNRDTGGYIFRNSADTLTVFSVSNVGVTTTSSNLIVRQPGGTGGTDELEITHDGTTAKFINRDSTGSAIKFEFPNAANDKFLLRIANPGTDASPNLQITMPVYGVPGGADFTSVLDGTTEQLSFGFNNQANFGGTAGASDGRLLYFYDRVASAYRGGFNASGEFFWGTTNTAYSVRFQSSAAGNVPATFKAAASQTADVVQLQNSGGTTELGFRPGGTIYSPPLTPAQITADQNDYAPGVARIYRLSSDASRTITGLVAGVNGESRQIINVGGNNIVLAHESGSSTAVNRFLTSTGANVTVAPNEAVGLMYDGTDSRWRVFA